MPDCIVSHDYAVPSGPQEKVGGPVQSSVGFEGFSETRMVPNL